MCVYLVIRLLVVNILTTSYVKQRKYLSSILILSVCFSCGSWVLFIRYQSSNLPFPIFSYFESLINGVCLFSFRSRHSVKEIERGRHLWRSVTLDNWLCGIEGVVAGSKVVYRLIFVKAVIIGDNILRVTNAKYVEILMCLTTATRHHISLPLVVTLGGVWRRLLSLIVHVLRVRCQIGE